jgi:muramoyltetrapeptide carboxypeptidase
MKPGAGRARPLLKRGDTVAVLAPAGPAAAQQVAGVAALYEAQGLHVRLYPSCGAKHPRLPFLAGSDAQRVADVHDALQAPDVAALHCLRGGWGSARLLPAIDAALVKAARKPLLGYSDITALHALWCAQGVPAWHAPMPASDLLDHSPASVADRDALWDALLGGLPLSLRAPQPHPLSWPGEAAVGSVVAQAEGRLVGGNLSIVNSLLGTPWALPMAGSILFLEDVNEDAYRIDRLLTQLRNAGELAQCSGFVLGSFSPAAHEVPATEEVLCEHLNGLGKPVLAGWPAGHARPNRPLPLGQWVRLDVRARALHFPHMAG